MKEIAQTITKKPLPIKVVQFGEGNFLRAFVDALIDEANEKGVTNHGIAIVKPIAYGNLNMFHEQDNLYTVMLRGKQDGKTVETSRVVTSIQKAVCAYEEYGAFLALARLDSLEIVVSNTTEAGIVYVDGDKFDDAPASSYPAKLTRFLYERYTAFSGDCAKGLTILPVELIEHNGKKLAECVDKYIAKWNLPTAFSEWLEKSCLFCDTLVDRIVTGYPRAEADALCEKLGYHDNLIDVGEPFGFWVIECTRPEEAEARLPLDKAGLPVLFTDNLKPYRERKVRILNGAHTAMVPAAYLSGQNIVRDCMEDKTLRAYLEKALEEILPTVKLPTDEVRAFANSVLERFANPFIDHRLLDICLNSISKWKARVLPSLLDCMEKNGELPTCLTFSFAALAAFYQGKKGETGFFGDRDGESYQILDDAAVLDFFSASHENVIAEFAAMSEFWGMDLGAIPAFVETASKWYDIIRTDGAQKALEEVCK